jgi:hypothetical protein
MVVGCCVVRPQPIDHRPSIPIEHNYVWPLLLVLLINRFHAAPSMLRICKQVDCCVIEVLLQQQQLHPSRCTSLVHKLTENIDLCTAIRPFSVVLMAESAASARSPATVEALEGIGWLWGWFGSGAEAAGHGFEG